jgi:hypothetical protein
MNAYLHDALCQLGLYWCGALLTFCVLFLLRERFGNLLKRVFVGVMQELSEMIMTAQKRRERRRDARKYQTSNIIGTTGYRIITR